jgi:hypothetical protein
MLCSLRFVLEEESLMKIPYVLKNEARDEAYAYFDKKIRSLQKKPDGKIHIEAKGLHGNDVDAFRHVYVSGVFAQEYGEKAAETFGLLNEWSPLDLYSNTLNPGDRNMDLWNNSIGRKLGLKAKNREELLKLTHEALKKGELIINPEDKREYKGRKSSSVSQSKPVIVIQKNEDGRNEVFYDTKTKKVLTLEDGYTVKTINGVPTPVSKPDGRQTNNLG